MAVGQDWNEAEIQRTVDDYFEMLVDEIEGRPYGKTEHRRALEQSLDGRSPQSIEFKHANISAVLMQLGFPFINGYKPRRNFQQALVPAVLAALEKRSDIVRRVETVADRVPVRVAAGSLHVVSAPPRLPRPETLKDSRRAPQPRRFDIVAREARNRELGRLGEEFVFESERARLRAIGEDRLAVKVEWTSRTKGDGLGYDIFSYRGGREEPLLIEVKTTNFGIRQPFYVTRNELRVSEAEAPAYRVVRLFEFSRAPKAFELDGAISGNCELEATSYEARR